MENRNGKYHILYGIMLAVFIFMIVWLAYHYEGPSLREASFSDATEFTEGWTTTEGEEVELSELNKIDSVKAYKEFSIYNTLPYNLSYGDSLCFRSKNIFYTVYINGRLAEDPYVPENPIYTKSFGTRWNYVKIMPEDAGGQIEIRITKVYDDARACIDNIYLGESSGVILDTIGSKIIAFITCVLILFVGFLLIVADIPINMQTQKNHELMYLGLFAVNIAIWCLLETNLLQFYISDSRSLQVVSCCSLMMIPIPMILYLNSAFGFRKKWVVSSICLMSFAEFVVCMVLHIFKIADVHETLKLTHALLVMSAVILFYIIIYNSFSMGKNQTKNVYRVLRGFGLSAISVATVIDMYRYYQGGGNDNAMFVRIGLLIFIICYGSSSLEKTINAVKLGVQAEFVSQLAYRDGLTGIGNRTAFEEHLVDLEKIKDSVTAVGIIMFDVNDLKYVNDNLGHHYGDSMLVKSADIIKAAFEEQQGSCFRIGGDEFAVLLSGENVQERYEQGIVKFQEGMKQHNAEPDKKFRISIAHGFAVYDKDYAGKRLMDTYQKADMLMYENKKQMKANQSKPEDYYREQVATS